MRKKKNKNNLEPQYKTSENQYIDICYDVEFNTIEKKSVLTAKNECGISFFIRRNGAIISKGYIAGGNEMVLYSGDEVAYIPRSNGIIRNISKK